MHSRVEIVFVASVLTTVICIASESQVSSPGIAILQVRDNACGPRCLWAVTQLTGVGKGDVNDIYRIIGRPVSSAVNLMDLKNAAVKIGFAAEGRRLKPSDLVSLRGYAILPTGKAAGTEQEPLHFVLVAGATKEEVVLVDTHSLVARSIPMAELNKVWAGPALVMSKDSQGNRLFQPLAVLDGPQPRGREIIDLGVLEVGSKISRTLIVSGTDDQTEWAIVGKSCHCLEAELSRDAAGRVVLSTNLEVKQGGMQVNFIAVASERAGVRKDYQFRVFGKNAHLITPDNGYFEAHEGRTEYPVTIRYFPGDANGPVTFAGIQTEIANLECGDPNIVETTYGDARAVTVSVPLIYTLTDAARGKTFKEDISFKLKTGSGDRSLSFPLTIKAGEASMRVTPETLLFLCSKSSTAATQKSVRIISASKIPESGLSVTPDAPIQLEIESRLTSAGEYVVDVSIKPTSLATLPVGLYRGKLTIALAGSGASPQMLLPITIAVRE